MGTMLMNRCVPGMEHVAYEVFQTGNPLFEIAQEKIIHQHVFERPVMDFQAISGIRELALLNGKGNIWFCGAYSQYGMPLLESAVTSAFHVAAQLGAQLPSEADIQSALARVKPRSGLSVLSLLVSLLAVFSSLLACFLVYVNSV